MQALACIIWMLKYACHAPSCACIHVKMCKHRMHKVVWVRSMWMCNLKALSGMRACNHVFMQACIHVHQCTHFMQPYAYYACAFWCECICMQLLDMHARACMTIMQEHALRACLNINARVATYTFSCNSSIHACHNMMCMIHIMFHTLYLWCMTGLTHAYNAQWHAWCIWHAWYFLNAWCSSCIKYRHYHMHHAWDHWCDIV